jgi:hypothetical protein
LPRRDAASSAVTQRVRNAPPDLVDASGLPKGRIEAQLATEPLMRDSPEITMASTRFTPKDMDEVVKLILDLPPETKVEADADTGILSKDVGQLCALPKWPDGYVLTVPRERYPESIVKISRGT